MRRANDPGREDALEHVEPIRHYEFRDSERFDRIAYALHALDVLSPPALTVAVYPANIHMALNPEKFPKFPAVLLWARLPVQGVFAWLTWRGTG